MTHALPDEYTAALQELTDAAGGISASEALEVVRKELRCARQDCSDLFASFDEQPLGRASLAQVHRATLKEPRASVSEAAGRGSEYGGGIARPPQEVAVKVQYPGLAGRALGDILGMRAIAGALAWLFPQHDYKWLLPDYEQVLAMELDFVQEAHNAGRARGAMRRRFGVETAAPHSGGSGTESYFGDEGLASASGFVPRGGRSWGASGWREWLTQSPADGAVSVPGVAWGLTSRRVLTMQLAKGVKPTAEGYQEL